jgi:hypothetical protein
MTFLGTVGTGRKRAEREEVAMEREKVRGTERAMVRSDSMLNYEGWMEYKCGRGSEAGF